MARGIVAFLAPLGFTMLADGLAAEPTVLRLGTGGVGGTYYPIGSLIAAGLSDSTAPGACAGAPRCGIPGVLAVAQVSNGSVANIEGLRTRSIEMAFAQSNVVDWAYNARARFEKREPARDLRAIATLYLESLHVVVRADAGISSISDLKDRRMSLDEPGSGTLDDAREVLRSFGLAEADLSPEYVKPDLAVARMLEGRLDGFFIVAGAPVATLREASPRLSFALLPVDGPAAERLLHRLPFYSRVIIRAGLYPGVPDTPTIGVGAQLIVRADLDEHLGYEITRALWSERMRRLLDGGHPKGREIRLDNALQGISIPLHPGAERFYREAGLLSR
ncbi:MAG TPA: TAXI family TRAP transporter solute-binding subunit [Alphaproteobacteria bacterium]